MLTTADTASSSATAKRQFDFATKFSTLESQNKGAEFEVLTDKKEPTGMFIRVIGPDAEARRQIKARMNECMLALSQSIRDKKEAGDFDGRVGSILADLNLEDAVAATVGWRYPDGFDGPKCTPEEVKRLYKTHPTLLMQVRIAADELGRFTSG